MTWLTVAYLGEVDIALLKVAASAVQKIPVVYDSGYYSMVKAGSFLFNFTGAYPPVASFGTPLSGDILVPSNVPKLRVVRTNDQNVPASPRGSFVSPDISLNIPTTSIVTVAVVACQVPTGTVVHLTIFSEDDTTQVVDTTPLAGTSMLSTALAQVTCQHGFSGISSQASFTP